MKYIKYSFYLLINMIRFIGKKSYKNLLLMPPSSIIHNERGATLKIGKRFRARRNVEIYVRDNAKLNIGNNVFLNSGCIIVCKKNIEIGDNTIIAPNVMIYDHNHKTDPQNGVSHREFVCGDIIIGKNVWIGAGAVILKGAKIGDNAVIGAGSIVTGNIPPNMVFIQKRETEMREIK